ncbi:hypothetical protein, partial [Streptomyces sp. NRRL WC-3774]|uniref:hypothetical protein n=1 Tax=Streptomyces sp. NRRL WC-3774 TaxID=1463937 RepID=UPI001F236BC9
TPAGAGRPRQRVVSVRVPSLSAGLLVAGAVLFFNVRARGISGVQCWSGAVRGIRFYRSR